MKTGLLFILLLGFGYVAPWSCTKKPTADERKPMKSNFHKTPGNAQQIALFAPTVIIKTGKRA
jgi:hypothetical protein